MTEYRRMSPYATGDKFAVACEVNRMIAAAAMGNLRWFWRGPRLLNSTFLTTRPTAADQPPSGPPPLSCSGR
jgi:hypothetical protein